MDNGPRELGIARMEKSFIELNGVRQTGSLDDMGSNLQVHASLLGMEEASGIMLHQLFFSLNKLMGGGQNENSQRHAEELEDKKCIHDPSCNNLEIAHDNNSSLQDEKKIPRNKVCPCGSKKKYKSCCGSAAGRSASRFAVNQTFDNGKVRKDKKQGKKGGPVAVKPQGSDGGLPDVGALCI
ncbi:unnamed protein product [Ilex paraguariensis]|uniref:Uncharacterized protein n=1 Tax=Ilex paraguariensis TaxID=185542 RepID=A0ABC8SQG3_9AQUA